MKAAIASLIWRRPKRELDTRTGFTWRRYLDRTGRYRVSVRVDGPRPFRFYAERLTPLGTREAWLLVGAQRHRSKAAAQAACQGDLKEHQGRVAR